MWWQAVYHKRSTLEDPQKEWLRKSEEVRDDQEAQGSLIDDEAKGIEASPGYEHMWARALALSVLL